MGRPLILVNSIFFIKRTKQTIVFSLIGWLNFNCFLAHMFTVAGLNLIGNVTVCIMPEV